MNLSIILRHLLLYNIQTIIKLYSDFNNIEDITLRYPAKTSCLCDDHSDDYMSVKASGDLRHKNIA